MKCEGFAVDDKFFDVVRVLEERGWSPTPRIDTLNYLLKWRNLQRTNLRLVRPEQYVNHLQHAEQLSNKAHLRNNLYAHHAQREEEEGEFGVDSFYPRTWDLQRTNALVAFLRFYACSAAVGALKRHQRAGPHGLGGLPSAERLRVCVFLAEGLLGSLRRRRGLGDIHAISGDVIEVGDGNWRTLFRHGTSLDAIFTPNDTATAEDTTSELGDEDESIDAVVDRVLGALAEADLQFSMSGDSNLWVVKAAGLSRGRGVVTVGDLPSLCRAATTCCSVSHKCVVQKYIERPLTPLERKFDIRLWVLVTSVNPLVIYGFSECYLRFCAVAFDLATGRLDDRFMHLCNNSVQHLGDGYDQSGIPGNMWLSSKFAEWLREWQAEKGGGGAGRDPFRDVIMPRLRRAVVRTVESASDLIEKRGRGFEWLGLDFMVSDTLDVLLLEVNVSPDVSHSTEVTAALVPRATEDLLQMVLDEGQADAIQDDEEGAPHGGAGPDRFTSPFVRRAAAHGRIATDENQRLPEAVSDSEPQWELWHCGDKRTTAADKAALRARTRRRKAWLEEQSRPSPQFTTQRSVWAACEAACGGGGWDWKNEEEEGGGGDDAEAGEAQADTARPLEKTASPSLPPHVTLATMERLPPEIHKEAANLTTLSTPSPPPPPPHGEECASNTSSDDEL